MTFTEAAAQVLRLVGKPLHYKEITDVAIEKNLLSHVGKSPEVTMGARLAALVKKGDKENPLVRIKPGVFALREWNQATINAGLADRTPALARLAAAGAEGGGNGASNGSSEHSADALGSSDLDAGESPAADASSSGWDEQDLTPMDAEEQRRAELAAHARELFEAEADDEDPIFGGEEEAKPAAAVARPGAEGDAASHEGRRRRRRGRRGRPTDDSDSDLPSYTVSDATAEAVEGAVEGDSGPRRLSSQDTVFEGEDPTIEPRRSDRGQSDRGQADRGQSDRGQSDRAQADNRGGREPRDNGGRDSRNDRNRDDRPRDDRPRDDRSRDSRDNRRDARPNDGRNAETRNQGEPRQADDLGARELASVLEELLSSYDRNRGPVSAQSLCDAAQRRGYLIGEGLSPGLFLSAARADNQRAWLEGRRPRFRVIGGRILPTEWLLDSELLRLEQDLDSIVSRYRDVARRGLTRMLADLPHRAVGELIVLLLERMGMREITRVRRTGAHGAELHLSATGGMGQLSGNGSGAKSAIVIRRDAREIGRERVVELRGALHHYGPAQAGWLITTGQVLSGAREEALAASATPITLVDGATLARLCEEHAVGVMNVRLNVPMPDAGLFDALRAAGG